MPSLDGPRAPRVAHFRSSFGLVAGGFRPVGVHWKPEPGDAVPGLMKEDLMSARRTSRTPDPRLAVGILLALSTIALLLVAGLVVSSPEVTQ